MYFPLVREYWIGNTFIYDSGLESAAAMDQAGNTELVELRAGDVKEIINSNDPEMRRRRALPGNSLRRFGARENGKIVGVCTYAFGEYYKGFYRLRTDEAELTDIFTLAECRGKGIAASLIKFSTGHMHNDGFRRVYAKVWHNNEPSMRAFQKAGWQRYYFFVRIELMQKAVPICVQYSHRSNLGMTGPRIRVGTYLQ